MVSKKLKTVQKSIDVLKASVQRLIILRDVFAGAKSIAGTSQSAISIGNGKSIIFDIAHWVIDLSELASYDDDLLNKTDLEMRTVIKRKQKRFAEAIPEHPCGSACCVAGTAGLLPEFRAMGFSWSEKNGFTVSDEGLLLRRPVEKFFNGERNRFAAFMGLKADQASRIVYGEAYKKPSEDITPHDVVERLNEIIKEQREFLRQKYKARRELATA